MHRKQRTEQPSGTRQTVLLLVLAFVVTLGVVIGTRMSSDAIAVLVGVVAGVAASIPTALLLMAVTRRRDDEPYEEPYDPRPQSPPVIVVTAGNPQQQLSPYASYPYQPVQSQPRRQFWVMGYDDDEDDVPIDGTMQSASWGR